MAVMLAITKLDDTCTDTTWDHNAINMSVREQKLGGVGIDFTQDNGAL